MMKDKPLRDPRKKMLVARLVSKFKNLSKRDQLRVLEIIDMFDWTQAAHHDEK